MISPSSPWPHLSRHEAAGERSSWLRHMEDTSAISIAGREGWDMTDDPTSRLSRVPATAPRMSTLDPPLSNGLPHAFVVYPSMSTIERNSGKGHT